MERIGQIGKKKKIEIKKINVEREREGEWKKETTKERKGGREIWLITVNFSIIGFSLGHRKGNWKSDIKIRQTMIYIKFTVTSCSERSKKTRKKKHFKIPVYT